MDVATRFSDQLEDWLSTEEAKTLGGLGELFAEKSFAVMILLLMFVPAVPLPTGGITHVFEVITVVLAAQMVIGRRAVWLPQRWQTRELGGVVTGKAAPFMVRRVRWFERYSRPRGVPLFAQRWFLAILGLVFIGLASAAGLAPPFSGLDTLPAMGAVVVALAVILEDIVMVAAGVLVGAGGVVLIVTLGAALVQFIQGIF